MEEKASKKKKYVIGVIVIISILAFSIMYMERQKAKLPKRLMDKEFLLDSYIMENRLKGLGWNRTFT